MPNVLRRGRKLALVKQWTVAPAGCCAMEILLGLGERGRRSSFSTPSLGSSPRKVMDYGFPRTVVFPGRKLLSDSPNLVMGLIGDGETLYFSKAFPNDAPGADPFLPYYSSPERPPYKSTLMRSPIMRNGGIGLHLDTTRHIFYSPN